MRREEPTRQSGAGPPRRGVVLAAALVVGVAIFYVAVRSSDEPAPDAATPSPASAPVPPSPVAAAPPAGASATPPPSQAARPPVAPGAGAAAPPATERPAMREEAAAGEEAATSEPEALAESLRTSASPERKLEAIDRALEIATTEVDPSGRPDLRQVGPLIDGLGAAALDPNPEVAEAAIDTLAEIQVEESLDALSQVLASGASEDVKLRAIDAITALDISGAARALIPGLADPSEVIRGETAFAASWVEDRDPLAFRALVDAQRQERDEGVRDALESAIEDIQWDLENP